MRILIQIIYFLLKGFQLLNQKFSVDTCYSSWETVDLSSYQIYIGSGSFWVSVLRVGLVDHWLLDDGSASAPTNSKYSLNGGSWTRHPKE